MVAEGPALAGFDYDYRMWCAACGQTTVITAHRYHERMGIDALSPCAHCEADIHYGPASAALRDSADPLLSNEVAAQAVWFHSSTYPDWPSSGYEDKACAGLDEGGLSRMVSAERVRRRLLTRALHLGTYEAAVENMLRRMQNQADADSVFYLHRVTLRIAAEAIEEGFRDENHHPASRLGIDELEDSGLLAVRYLNVHEAMGSLSLAIDPAVIDTIATIELPVGELASEPSQELLERLSELDAEIAAATGSIPDTSHIDAIELRMRELFPQPGDDIAAALESATERSRAAWDQALELLERTYLSAGANAVVRDDFVHAMTAGDNDSVQALHRRYRAYAALLTHSEQVVDLLGHQPVRPGEQSQLVRVRRESRNR
ncbi:MULTISPECIES: hypothetical protein [unclassified Nocardia]|uniref:hypothetical protein n=1 Tax=unclassified Nocardia TaxID=2637762 RepID=UPI0024A9DC63|nr:MULTISPECIES: hypothetical protein [unclassified Nocardia]